MSYEAIQQAVREQTSTTGTYEEDWIALFDAESVASGFFNERMLAWINNRLETAYSFLPDAKRAFAQYQGFNSWGEINMAAFIPARAVVTRDGAYVLTRAGAYVAAR